MKYQNPRILRNNSWAQWLGLAWIAVLAGVLLVGCASTGGGAAGSGSGGSGATADAAAAMPDYTDEMGANGLPTPRALRTRHIAAVGGEKALLARKSVTTRGKMELAAMGISGDVVIHAAEPNKLVMNIEMGGMGSMSNGYNGEVGWSDNPMTGAALLEGDALEDFKQQADFDGDLHYAKTYPTQETVEKVEWNGESAYKVRLVDARGKESTQYYSEANGWLIGGVSTQSSPMGDVEVSAKVGDYKKFGDLMLATTQVMDQAGMEIKTTIEEVVYDAVEDSDFVPPASIKALLDQ